MRNGVNPIALYDIVNQYHTCISNSSDSFERCKFTNSAAI